MPDDVFTKWAVPILWSITAVFMAWTWIPAIRSALGLSRFVAHGDEETFDLGPADKEVSEPEYVNWYYQLTELGFQPLGHGWLRVIDAGPRWMMQSLIRVFYSRESQCYAMIQREAPPLDAWYSVTFATCMTDGGMVLNGNFVPPATVVHPMFISGGLNTLELGELLIYHQAVVENEKSQYGRRIEPGPSLDVLLTGTREFYDHIGRVRFKADGKRYMISEGLMHLCVSLPAWLAFGAEHWGLPLSNIILYFALRVGEFSSNRGQGEFVAQAIREQARERNRQRREAGPLTDGNAE